MPGDMDFCCNGPTAVVSVCRQRAAAARH
jgi:hypothetical protein